MKQPQKLEILRYFANGELNRRVVCLAGSVSVFRSNDENLLEKYSNLLLGKGSEEKFEIILDGSPCNLNNLMLIGNQDLSTHERPLTQYLIDSGFPNATVADELAKYGLETFAHKPCCALAPVQWRIAQIMASWWTWNRISVLFDPFRGMPAEYIEPLAVRIAKTAWEVRSIVVVPDLKVRPNSWVENELVQRVALERPKKRTVGSGNGRRGSGSGSASSSRTATTFRGKTE